MIVKIYKNIMDSREISHGYVMQVLTVGFLVADIIAADLPRIANPGELVFAPKGIVLHIGGHPANVAVDLVKLGVPPKEICVVGALGKDTFGDFIEQTLRDYGLTLRLQRVDKVGTTKDMILIVKGEDRRFHVDLGASWFLDPSLVMSVLEELKPKIAYFAVGITGKLDENIEEVISRAKNLCSITFVDIVRPYGKDWDFIVPALKYVDIFHCNDIELLGITKMRGLLEGIREMMKLGVKLLLVTMGEKGAYGACNHYVIYQPAYKVNVIDPTGAGDAFCAGVLYFLLNRYIPEISPNLLANFSPEQLCELLLWAQAVGAIKCTAIGTTTAVSYEGTRALIESQGDELMRNTRQYNLRG